LVIVAEKWVMNDLNQCNFAGISGVYGLRYPQTDIHWVLILEVAEYLAMGISGIEHPIIERGKGVFPVSA
jgi:hypothetical protein